MKENSLKRIFISGTFNVLHPGHLRLFRYARELGDHLIVGVTEDLISTPPAFIPLKERIDSIYQCRLVDEVIEVKNSIINVIKDLKPDIVLKGKEFANINNEESQIISSYGGLLIFSSGDQNFNSWDLLETKQIINKSNIIFPEAFAKRHEISARLINDILQKIQNQKLLVVGDLILDDYINCEPLGMSQEDGNIILEPIDTTRFIGGAGVVAKHAAGLGVKAIFATVLGNDEAGSDVAQQFKGTGIDYNFFYEIGRKTSVKKRYRLHQRPVFRLSELSQHEISIENQKNIYEVVASNVESLDLLIFSDFNYGVLGINLVEKILKLAKKKSILVSADCQSSSQYGDIFKYKGVNLVTPTEYEIRTALRSQDTGLAKISREFFDKIEIENLIITLGADGLFLESNSLKNEKQPELIPSFARNVLDVSGAGDSLLVLASLALSTGSSLEAAAYIGSIGAAIQTQRIGNIPLFVEDLAACIKR
jgi:rfaE bifunctional protein kinase chain/domain